MKENILKNAPIVMHMLLDLSFFLLLGLFLAGIFHVFIQRKKIEKLIGNVGFKGVFYGALIGIPLPLCSCSVIPISIELKKKNASYPSILSFLITTPESGIDSILLTYVLIGPSMAIARPIASFFSAFLGGFLSIWFKNYKTKNHSVNCKLKCCKDIHALDSKDQINFKVFLKSLKSIFFKSKKEKIVPFSIILKKIFRYSFIDMGKEILPSFIFGLIIAIILVMFLPQNLEEYGIFRGSFSYVIMLLASIPIYVCASASTPIAAALIFKGINPGAILVFLLAGPSTNIVTIVMLMKNFGKKFISIFLVSIAFGAVISGVIFDKMLKIFKWSLTPFIGYEEPYFFSNSD